MAMTDIVEQHADEASFLWFRRDVVVDAPHFTLQDLGRLDERLEAHLDGLVVAGPLGWEACKANMKPNEVESLFPAAVLAFQSGSDLRLKPVFDAVGEDTKKARPLISALGWLDYPQVQQQIERLLCSNSPFHRYLGVAASAIHRRHPGRHLQLAASAADALLNARALRTYGELGCGEWLDGSLRPLDDYPYEEIGFYAHWSAALAGNKHALDALASISEGDSRYAYRALVTAFCCLPFAGAMAFYRKLAGSPTALRKAVIGAGLTGDPALVPWLLDRMRQPALARVAGEAITMITGMDLDRPELAGLPMEECDDDTGAAAGPDESDYFLPWPDPEKVFEWWKEYGASFTSGTRYFLGQPLSAGNLQQALKVASQRQRVIAALLMAAMRPGKPLLEVRAPAYRQDMLGDTP